MMLGTINNYYLNKINLPKLKNIQVFGLSEDANKKVANDLTFLKFPYPVSLIGRLLAPCSH